MDSPDQPLSAPQEEAPTPWPKPTLEQMSKAESLIRQAEILRRRGESQQVFFMIQEAYKTAPTFSDAIVAYCGELIASNKVGEAMAILDPAHKGMPKDVPIERLFAEMVLRTRFHIGDYADLEELNSSYASNKAAIVLSVALPGLGHMAILKFVKGGIFMAAYLLAFAALVLIPNGVAGLIGSVTGDKRVPLQAIAFLPLGVMVVTWIWALFDVTALSKTRPKLLIEPPKPPTNDPF